MTSYQFTDEDGSPIDAHFDVRDGELVLHSRGGTMGSSNARNTQYGPALRIILERTTEAGLTIEGVWVDSSRVQGIPLNERRIYFPSDLELTSAELFTQLSNRMAAVGRDPDSKSRRGNSNKRLLFRFKDNPAANEIVQAFGGVPSKTDLRSLDRLPAEMLRQVTAEQVWHAVQRLKPGSVEHGFGASTDYDVLDDEGNRLPPKAVFGLAATEALGFEVLPQHFSAGIGTPCFQAITEAGFEIVPKNEPAYSPGDLPSNPDDKAWVEGNPQLVQHLRRERGAGLAPAKKAAFIREHGRLFCERCQMDPVEQYGDDLGDACIEVHHTLAVADMAPGHETRLEDLVCLCANCHRVLHRQLRNDQNKQCGAVTRN